MTAIATGQYDAAALISELFIGSQRAGHERFFQPQCAAVFQRLQTLFRYSDIIDPDGTGIDQQNTVVTQTLARCMQLVGVGGNIAMTERSPAEFSGAITQRSHSTAFFQRFLSVITE
jgi:hypothetical protein